MNQYLTKERNLLERFSSLLVKDGKKGSGHRILLESLFFLRQNADRNVLDLFTQKNNLILLRKTKKVPKINKFSTFFNNNKLLNRAVDMQEREKKGDRTADNVALRKKQKLGNLQNKKEKSNKKKEFFSRGIAHMLIKDVENITPEKALLTISPNKSICKNCVENVKPILETRKVRKGRVTYRVPLVTHTQRQEGKAVSFLVEHAILKKKGTSQAFKKSIEIKPLDHFHAPRKHVFSHPLQSKIVGNEKVSIELLKKKVQKDLLSFSSEKQMLLIASLKRLNFYSIKQTLSEQFSDAFFKKGESVEKKKQLHSLALQNRAYTHYRWW